jgi:cytidyltransferase-like protein
MTRIKNYYYARQRNAESDELVWVNIPGLTKLALPRPVVMVNGSFDLLHAGHMRLLATAREKAGVAGTVLVAMDSDERVAAAKGPQRPIMKWTERAVCLGYFPIDYLIEISSEAEMHQLVELVKPDLRVQGSDYVKHASRFPEIPRCFVMDRSGIRTSSIIKRIVERYGNGQRDLR